MAGRITHCYNDVGGTVVEYRQLDPKANNINGIERETQGSAGPLLLSTKLLLYYVNNIR